MPCRKLGSRRLLRSVGDVVEHAYDHLLPPYGTLKLFLCHPGVLPPDVKSIHPTL